MRGQIMSKGKLSSGDLATWGFLVMAVVTLLSTGMVAKVVFPDGVITDVRADNTISETSFTGTLGEINEFLADVRTNTDGKKISELELADNVTINLTVSDVVLTSQINSILTERFGGSLEALNKIKTVNIAFSQGVHYDADITSSYREDSVSVTANYSGAVIYLFVPTPDKALATQMQTYVNQADNWSQATAVQIRANDTTGRYNMAKNDDTYIMNAVTNDDASACSVSLAGAIADYQKVTSAITDKKFVLSLAGTKCSDDGVASISTDAQLNSLALNVFENTSADKVKEIAQSAASANQALYVGAGDYTVQLAAGDSAATISNVYADVEELTVTEMADLASAIGVSATAVETTETGFQSDYKVSVDGETVSVEILNENVNVADVAANLGTLTSVSLKKGTQTVTVSTDETDKVAAVTIGGVPTYYGSFAEALIAIDGVATSTVTLLNNTTFAGSWVFDSGRIAVDLNGKTLTYTGNSSTVFQVNQGAHLSFVNNDSTDGSLGKIVDTNDNHPSVFFRIYGSSVSTDANVSSLSFGANTQVESYAGWIVVVGPVEKKAYGAVVNIDGELIGKGVNCGVITIHGNISDSSSAIGTAADGSDTTAAKVYINDGAVLTNNAGSGSVAAYSAGSGLWIFGDASLHGYDNAFEIRSGTARINGGNFIADAIPAFSTLNNSGTTSQGAAIAIAQYGNSPIDVTVTGGVFSAYTPVYESDPNGTTTVTAENTKLAFKGGYYEVINGGDKSVYSQDLTKFLTGGTYSVAPNVAYLADSYINHDNGDGTYTVMHAYDSVSAAITALAGDSSEDLPAVKVVTSDTDSAENNALVAKDSGYYRVEAAEAGMSAALAMANSLIETNPVDVLKATIAYAQLDGNIVNVQAASDDNSKREINVSISNESTQSLPSVSDAWHIAATDQINEAVSTISFEKNSEAVTVYLDKKKVVTQMSEPTLTTALAQYQAAATSEAQVAVDYYRTQPNDMNGNTITHFVSLKADGDKIKAEMHASSLAEALAAYETLSSELRAKVKFTCSDDTSDGLTYEIATDSDGKVSITDTTSAANDDIGSVFASFLAIGEKLGSDVQSSVQIVDEEGKFTILLMPQNCGDTTYCSDDFAGQVLVMTSGTPAAAQTLVESIKAANANASFIMMVSTTSQTVADAGLARLWSFIRPVQAAEASYYGVEVVNGTTQAVLVTAVDASTDTYLSTHATSSVKLIEDNSQTATQVNLVSAHEDQEVVKAALAAFQQNVRTASATLTGKDFVATNDDSGKLTSVAFSGDITLDEVKVLMAATSDSVTVTLGGQTYTFVNGQLYVSTPSSPAGTNDANDRHASGDNVPNEAAPQGCHDTVPAGVADVFQIDRQGSKATIYFAPIPGAHNYHVVFGHQAGDERYGGIAMSADDVSGVLAIDVTNLEPSQQYSFKIAPVNGCAVGSWSNWLTAKGVARYGKTVTKTYRYTGSTK